MRGVVTATENFRRSVQLLGTRRFGTFWFASFLSNVGTWAQQVAQPWLLLNLGASSFLLGLDAFAMGAPVLALTLVGGYLADRADRRRVIASFQSLQMLCPTLIVVLLWAGGLQPWIVIAMSLIVGITDALSMPSFQSIVPSIVAREQLPAGIALNSTQFNLSRIVGPAVAGMLMAGYGAAGAFTVSALSYLPFILVALWILPRGARPSAKAAAFDRAALGAAVRAVARDRALRGALLTVLAGSFLCAPLLTFAPVLVMQSFQGNIAHFSLIMGAFGVGGLLGATVLLGISPEVDRRSLANVLALAYAATVICAAVATGFWMLPLLFVLAGAAMTVCNSSANTLLLAKAPPELRGQSVSLFMIAVRGGSSAGSLVTGASVALLGVRHALLIDGALAIAAQLLIRRGWSRA
jgi:MFS family permease